MSRALPATANPEQIVDSLPITFEKTGYDRPFLRLC